MATLEELNKKLLEIESNNQNTNIEELNKILAEEDKEEDFVSAEEAGIKINPSELLSKDEILDLVLVSSLFAWANRLMHILGDPIEL